MTVASASSLDALYKPFEPFAAWPRHVDGGDEWADGQSRLEARRARAPAEAIEQAFALILRSATIDYITRDLSVHDATQQIEAEVAGFMKGELSARQTAELRAVNDGYRLVIAASKFESGVTDNWLKALHGALCAPQKTHSGVAPDGTELTFRLPKAGYKVRPNHVQAPDGSLVPYAPVSEVASEMNRLLIELRAPDFAAAHPAVQAAFAILSLLVIHPFADGNGRVARALASVYTHRAVGLPLLVFFDQRLEYVMALDVARLGDYRPLIRFVGSAILATMALFEEALAAVEAPEATLDRLGRLLNQGLSAGSEPEAPSE